MNQKIQKAIYAILLTLSLTAAAQDKKNQDPRTRYIDYEEYDPQGNKILYKEWGTWIEATYNKDGKVVKEIRTRDNKCNTVTYEYDRNGNCMLEYSDEDSWTKFEYDERNNMIRSTDSDGDYEFYEYNEKNQLVKDGFSTSGEITEYLYFYDEQDRLIKDVCNDESERNYFYNEKNQLVKIESNYEYREEFGFDEKGKERYHFCTSASSSFWYEKDPVYGENGLPARCEYRDPRDHYTACYTYNEKNQLVHEKRSYKKRDSHIEDFELDIEYKYDDDDNLILERHSDDVDYVYEREYFDSGRLKKYCKYKIYRKEAER